MQTLFIILWSAVQGYDTRIIGPQRVPNANIMPWHAGLTDIRNDEGIYCGGTIISMDAVLTAGHCVDLHLTAALIVSTGHLSFDEKLAKTEKGYQTAWYKLLFWNPDLSEKWIYLVFPFSHNLFHFF